MLSRAPRRTIFAVAATVALGALLPAAGARAAATQESMFQDDNLLLYRGDDVSDRTLTELRALGVTAVRVTVPWRAFAPDHRAKVRPASFTDPTDPSQYAPQVFDIYDHLLREARHLKVKVLFNVTGGAPVWATGTLHGVHPSLQYKPDPRQFRQFVQMLGTRFDGTHDDENQGGASIPRVSLWSIWNEPNQGAGLQPQWERTPRGRFVEVAPRLYRALARNMISALQATGHGTDTILLGETAPRGVGRRDATGSLRPVTFLAALLCLNPQTLAPLTGRAARDQACDRASATRPLAVTGYGHHPYSITSSPSTPDPNGRDATLADVARLGRVLDAGAAHGLVPAGLPYWFTESGWQTLPPDPIRGVAPALQAQWIAEAELQTRENPRVAALTQFLLLDDLPRTDPGETLERKWGTYQTGLEWSDGTHKPSYDAYRLPFVLPPTAKAGGPVIGWGMVRPVTGGAVPGPTSAQLQVAGPSGDFQDTGQTIPVGSDGAFTVPIAVAQAGRYRFTWAPPVPPRTLSTGIQAFLHPQASGAAPKRFVSAVASVS